MFKNNKFIQSINRRDMFSPYIFFPALVIIYFFLSIFDFGRANYFNAHHNIVPLIVVGLVAYYVVVYIVQKLNLTFFQFKWGFIQGKNVYFLAFLGLIGLISYLIMLFTGQIGILDESIRRNLNPKLNFFSSLLWFASIFLVYNQIVKDEHLTKKRLLGYFSILAIVFCAFILMGYRTPIALMFFTTLIVFHYVIKRIKAAWLIVFMVVLGLCFVTFGFLRLVSEDTTKEFNSRKAPQVEVPHTAPEVAKNKKLQEEVNKTPKWVRAINGEMVAGRIVTSKIIDYTKDNGYMYGNFDKGIFSTVLPGEQVSPRALMTDIVNSYTIDQGKYITRPGRTTTPTMVGQFYIEGGYIGIVIGFGLYGLILSMLYNQVRKYGGRSYYSIAYGFVLSVLAISIHTGLLDLIFLLMMGYAILSTSLETSKKKSNP
ncbi:oligosaccharide repeat unit polymerase [Priestia megaterium]|nr:oligosaccharide repeat unit polymerase family protein [Bacillus zanthoxyli]